MDEGTIRDAALLIHATFRNTSVHTLSAVTMRILWLVASQRSLHNAPIFRLLLKVAVNGTHQCDSIEFLRDRKIPTNTKVGAGDKNAASCNCMRASDTFLTQCSRVSTFDGAMIALGTARISCFEILLCQAELCQTLRHSRLFLNTSSRIPFGDHPLKLERYRED